MVTLDSKEQFTPIDLVVEICRFIEDASYLYLDEVGDTSKLDTPLTQNGYEISDATRTAVALGYFWAQEYRVDQIEDEAGINATSLGGTARQVSRTLDAASELFPPLTVEQPSWYDDLVACIKHGVKRDATPVATEVRGIGRNTIRELRSYLQEYETGDTRFNTDAETLGGFLVAGVNQFGPDKWAKALENVPLVAKRRAGKLITFTTDYNDPDDLAVGQALFSTQGVQPKSVANPNSDFRSASLAEYE